MENTGLPSLYSHDFVLVNSRGKSGAICKTFVTGVFIGTVANHVETIDLPSAESFFQSGEIPQDNVVDDCDFFNRLFKSGFRQGTKVLEIQPSPQDYKVLDSRSNDVSSSGRNN